MRRSKVATILFLLSGSIVLPLAVSAQQLDTSNSKESQLQSQNTPVQPERTPQQSDQARKQDDRNAEGTRMNPNWTTQRRDDDRADMDRMRQRHMGRMMEQEDDRRTVGRNWRRDDYDMDRRPGYGDRSEGRYYNEARPRKRVKICVEYENGDEFCRYRE